MARKKQEVKVDEIVTEETEIEEEVEDEQRKLIKEKRQRIIDENKYNKVLVTLCKVPYLGVAKLNSEIAGFLPPYNKYYIQATIKDIDGNKLYKIGENKFVNALMSKEKVEIRESAEEPDQY